MLGPFDPTPIIERLRTEVPSLRFVGGAADQAKLDEQRLPPMPAAIVLLAGEDIRSAPVSGGVMTYTAIASIDVVVGVRHARTAERGQAHADRGLPIVGEIRAVLNNWAPNGSTNIFAERMASNGRCQLLRLDEDVWWWVDRYQFTYRSRT